MKTPNIKPAFLLSMIYVMAAMSCGKSNSPKPTTPAGASITVGTYYILKQENRQTDGSYVTETMTTCEAAELFSFGVKGYFQADSQSCGVAITGTWTYDASTAALTAIDASTNQPNLKGTVSNLSSGGFTLTETTQNIRLTFTTTL